MPASTWLRWRTAPPSAAASASPRARSSRPSTRRASARCRSSRSAPAPPRGCGSCTRLCQDLLRAVAPDFEEEKKKVHLRVRALRQDQLRDILRSQKLKSVQEVLEIYGNGVGCEVCKPALSYMLDMLWCGDHDEDRSARFINDRVHANIQKDGTFSVVPRIRGGVTTPDELRRIADVADKYHVPMVKITGSQRIDLLGVRKADLPKVWADLGMPSGQAYTKGVRMVKTCVGTEFCRFGTQDSTSRGRRAGAAVRAALHAAQGEDGGGRVPAQLRRGHGQGHRPGRRRRRLAGGGRRRGGQEGPQGRPVDHGRDHGAGAARRRSCSSSTTARTPTISSAPTTSSSGWASRKSARKRSTRPRRCRTGCSIACTNRRHGRRTRGRKGRRRVHPTQFIPLQPLETVRWV